MFRYEPSQFVEPLGYQPVEFLDVPPLPQTDDDRPGGDPGRGTPAR
jgi:hypothetical protein